MKLGIFWEFENLNIFHFTLLNLFIKIIKSFDLFTTLWPWIKLDECVKLFLMLVLCG